MTNRINWLDVSRGLAFLMVIYSHLELCDSSVMKFFSPIFLTTFFFVSGYLFKEGQTFLFVFENRTRTLLLPFLILGGMMILMSQILSFNEHVPLLDSIKGLLFQNGENQLLWFIAALYVYSLIFYWMAKWCRTTDRLLIVSLLFFVLNTAYSRWLELPSLPWHICSAGYACFYMALGKWYKSRELKIDGMITNVRLLALTLVYVCIIGFFDLHINFAGSPYVVDALFVTIVGLAICVMVSKRFLNNSRFLLFVGANTLFYFAFHGKVYSLLETVTDKMMVYCNIDRSFAVDILIGGGETLIDALILILPAMFVNRYIPQILGRGFKLWKVQQ